jgi:hypothetical protein
MVISSEEADSDISPDSCPPHPVSRSPVNRNDRIEKIVAKRFMIWLVESVENCLFLKSMKFDGDVL